MQKKYVVQKRNNLRVRRKTNGIRREGEGDDVDNDDDNDSNNEDDNNDDENRKKKKKKTERTNDFDMCMRYNCNDNRSIRY